VTRPQSIYELFQSQRGDLRPQHAVAMARQGRRPRATARIAHSGRRSLIMQVDIISLPGEELAAIATVSFATVRRTAASNCMDHETTHRKEHM